MGKLSDFRDVISLWPTINSFGEDVGVSEDHAHQMKHRNSVPSKYWEKVVDAAKKHGHKITYELLAKISADRITFSGSKKTRIKRSS